MSADSQANGQEIKASEEDAQILASLAETTAVDPPQSLSKEIGGEGSEFKEESKEASNGMELPSQSSSFIVPPVNQPDGNAAQGAAATNAEMEEEEEEEEETSGDLNERIEGNSTFADEEEIDAVTGEKRKRINDDDWKPSSPGGTSILPGKKKLKKVPIKKKPKIKKVPEGVVEPVEGEKMSFQEAAIQVLAEQREKGVYALSTRRIWELISQSGLVDTKCKTPVSSLSSRITEDVRTKGNKSVFVRVGEGLYTLRKGLKKHDIEKFLNAKYPNMAHGSDLDHQFSEDEQEESSTIANNNQTHAKSSNPQVEATQASISDQFEKILQENRENAKDNSEAKKNPSVNNAAPRQIPVRFTKPPTSTSSTTGAQNSATPNSIPHGNAAAAAAHFVAKAQALNANNNQNGFTTKPAISKSPVVVNSKGAPEAQNKITKPTVPPQIKLKENKWVGLPLKRKNNGDVYYTSVKIDNNTYRIGDCVYFEPSVSGDEAKDKEKGTTLPYIGKITKLFQTVSKTRMKAHGGTMLVECSWYFYPEDTKNGRRQRHHKREVFVSNISDINNVNTIKSAVQVLSFPEFNQVVNSPANTAAEELPADIFFCRSFYDEVSQTFHPLTLDYKTGNFQFSTVNNHALNRVKNWPKDVEFTSRSVWGEISEGVKELLDTKHKPYVSLHQLSANNSSPTTVLVASTFLSEGTILGDYQGVVVNNTEEAASHYDPNGSVRTLYEDHEVLVSVDVSECGNEFRFMRNVSVAKVAPNVKLCTVYLDGKWHLLVQTIKTINKGEEIVVDLSESSMPDLEGYIDDAISSPEPMVMSSTRHNLLENNDRLFNFGDPPKLMKPKKSLKTDSSEEVSLKTEDVNNEESMENELNQPKEEETQPENVNLTHSSNLETQEEKPESMEME